MKKFWKMPSFLILGAAMACSMTACSDDTPANTSESSEKDTTFKAIAEQYVNNTVIATYKNLADNTARLVEDLNTMKTARTQEAVNQACETFLQAREEWEKSEAFLFGAAGDFGIDPHIDSWPLDEKAFQQLMSSDELITAMSGEDGDVVAGERFNNSLLGFHGIEYILFRDGNPRAVGDIQEKEYVYAYAVAGDLRNRCWELELSWAGEGNVEPERFTKVAEELELNYTVAGGSLSYGENMIQAGVAGSTYASMTAAMEAIIDGCKTIADEVGTQKIGKPHSGEDIAYIESPYSHMSITDFYHNIVSIENAYMGGIEGKRDESKSLHAYIKSINAELDTRVSNAISNAETKIKDGMKAPFVINYADPSAQEAMNACAALDEILSEVKAELRK